MTMKIFLGFQRKPAKSPASSVARAFGMTEQPNDDGLWVFGKNRFRISLEDLRTDLQPEHREWADEVGWTQNWALSIAVHHRNRTDADYIKWHSLVVVIMEAYDATLLWSDAGTDTPQFNMRLHEFIPSLKSDEADDMTPDEEPSFENTPSEETVKDVPQMEPQTPEIPDSLMDALRAQLREEMQADTQTTAEVVDEPVVVPLEPVELDDEDFDTFDDWDDEDEDEDEETEVGPITDWD